MMKKLVVSSVFFLLIVSLPLIALGKTKETSPYDMVTSDGEVVPYSEIENTAKSAGIKLPDKYVSGTGEKFDSKDFKKFDTSKLKPEKIFDKRTLLPAKIDNSQIFKPTKVIGSDGRTKVKNTNVSPYKMISYFYGENSKYSYTCTGNVIGKDMIITNAHCVYDTDEKQYIKYGYAIPGLNDSHYSYGAYEMKKYLVPQGYISSKGSSQYDFAVIKLKPTPGKNIGDVVGVLPTKQVTNIKGTTISITGYPGDLSKKYGAVSQFGMSGKVTSEDKNVAYYSIDTASGQSGAAMLNSSGQIIGLHNAAYSSGDNGGPKMTKPMRDFISYANTQ
ncbi:hypothetical protein AAV29_10590 [Bacillus velezensis]|nr:hypothetical protein AAV29_10590 [Bacillus velezensis]